jgi:outer membrane protein TolC
MGGLVDEKQAAQRRCLWRAGLVVWLLMGLLCARSLCGQTPAAPPRGRSTPGTTPATPPAGPGAATERVLELTLEAAIRLALQHNLDIERERYSPPIAHTEVEQGRAAFDPTIGMDTSYSQTRSLPVNSTLLFNDLGVLTGTRITRQFGDRGEATPWWRHKVLSGGNYEIRFINTRENVDPVQVGGTRRIVDPRYQSQIQLTFTQPLLRDFGIAINTAPIRQAAQAELIAAQQLLQAILDTVLAAQQSYWDLVFRIQDLAVKRESQKLAEDFLAENKVRVELGTLAPVELIQAETQVKTREGDVLLAEAAVGQAEDRVKEVLNLPETLGTWQLHIRPTDNPPFVPITAIPVQEMVLLALKNRPDFVRTQLDIASREIAREIARNQLLPRLDMIGRGSLSAFGDGFDKSIGDIADREGYDWAIGLQFQYPLGNRLARNEYLQRQLELQQAQVDQRRLIRTIVRDVRQAIRDIETSSKRVEVTRQASELARIQLEAEQEKFRLGLSTSFNVLTFQQELSAARSNETSALTEYNVAVARLDQLTGKLQYDDFSTTSK